MDISPQDRDLITRTVIGEADNQPEVGQAAVAHVILNRLKTGGYGDDVKGVLFKPKQFEPWNTRAKELLSYNLDEPKNSKIKSIVDDVITGNIIDPTNGATHFANVDEVKRRGNRSALSWLGGMENKSQIGSHTFGNADAGRKMDKDDFSDLINEFGPSKASDAKVDNYNDLIKEFGGAKPAPVAEPVVVKPASAFPMVPGGYSKEEADKIIADNKLKELNQPGTVRKFIDFPSKTISNVISATGEHLAEAKKQIESGVNDIGQSNVATGVGKVGLGILQGAVSPITGATQELVEKPVTQLTGNKAIGERAGVVAGFGLPVKKTASTINALRPSEQAVKNIVNAVGKENLPEVISRLRSNDRLSLADVSPGVQQMTQKLVVTEGNHQNKLAKFIENRADTAHSSVTGAVDKVMGPPVNIVEKLNEMKINARTTGKQLIEPVVKSAGAVDITNVVKHIDNAIADSPVGRQTLKALKEGKDVTLPPSDAQSKLIDIREKLRGDWKDRDQMFLDAHGEQGAHEIQKTLRAEAQSLLDSHVPADRSLGKKLMDVRNKLVDAIDAKTSGEYKKGLSKYADEMHVQNAFDRGVNILKNPADYMKRPEFLEADWKTFKSAEKEAMREGTRVAYDTVLRGYKNAARKGEDIVAVDFNVKNLETIFGKDKAAKMVKALEDERAIADTNVKLMHGSQTAMRLKANKSVDLPVKQEGKLGTLLPVAGEILSGVAGGIPGVATAAYGINKLGSHYLHASKVGIAKKKNEVMSNLLTATGPERDALINILSNHIGTSQPKSRLRIAP